MEHVKLGDIATYINGYPFKPEDRGSEGLPIIRIQDLTGNSYDLGFYSGEYPERIEINDGDVLISWSGSLGVYLWNKGKALLNQHIFKVVFDKIEIDKKYFIYVIQHSLRAMEAKTHGATMKHITKKDFDSMLVPYPNLQRQQEIARILGCVESVISKRKQQLAELDNLIKARFVEMFGDPANNPLSWTTNSLSRLLLIERGGSPRPIDAYITDSNDGVNWIKIGDAKPGSIYITRTKQKIKSEGSKKSRYVKPGDFILSNSMSFGRPYIMKIDGYIHDGWLLLRDEKGLFNNLFLHTMLSLDYTYNCFKSMAEGGVVNNLNKDLVGKLVVYIPPIDLQNQFASFVEQIDKSKVVVQKALEEAQLLFDSLMQEYFG